MRDTLRELAAEQPSSSSAFADRVLADRRRHRNRRLVSVATATTVVRPAHVVQNGGVRAHPEKSPPRNVIGAGDEVLAGYFFRRGSKEGLQRFYNLDSEKVAAPANERHLRADVAARLSPDGRLAVLGLTVEAKETHRPPSPRPVHPPSLATGHQADARPTQQQGGRRCGPMAVAHLLSPAAEEGSGPSFDRPALRPT
jgi:hypothetical protein